MAANGNVDTNYVGNMCIRFSWSVTGTTVNWTLTAIKGDSGYRTIWQREVIINGTQKHYSNTSTNAYNGTKLASGSFTTGASFTVAINAGIGQQSYNASASATQYPNVYANITELTINSRVENSISINYKTDRNAWLFCSIDGGVTWLNKGEPFASNVTSGTITINYKDRNNTQRLSPNTKYTITVLCRADGRDGSLDTRKSIEATTYDYPHCTVHPNFTIGNDMKLTLYNPLKRNCTVTMYGDDWSVIYTGSGWTGTSVGNFNDNTIRNALHKSIPTKISGTYHIKVKYGDVERDVVNAGTYSRKKTAWANVNGTWKNGIIWTNVNGTWKPGVLWTNVNGTWKQCL